MGKIKLKSFLVILSVQEKGELYQTVQRLELELQRSQLGREGFTQQVCDLHSELTQAKSQASQLQQSTLLMKEDLHSAKEVRISYTTFCLCNEQSGAARLILR